MGELGITGLDHVQLEAPTGCEDAARAFFGELLGLSELRKPAALQKNGGCWFALPGNQQLHIGVVENFVPRRKGHLALRCTHLATVKAALTARNIDYREDGEAGVPRLFLADPWGNRLEIVEGQHGSVAL